MKPITEDIVIYQGADWEPVLQWLSETPTHKVISDVAIGLPTVVTATAHGITGTDRVPVWITNVQGPRALNTNGYAGAPPLWATVVDVDTLAVDFDSGALSKYVKGGVLTYRAPVDLTGWSAREEMRTSLTADTTEVVLTTDDGGVTLSADGKIQRFVTAAASDALTPFRGVHILELTDTDGRVRRFAEGTVCVSRDFPAVTT